MDPISDVITSWKIPVGQWGKALIDFVVTYFQWLFDAIKAALNWSVEGTSALLLMVPPVLLAVILAGLAYWLRRSWVLALGVLVGFLFIINQGLWKETVQTLVLVVAAQPRYRWRSASRSASGRAQAAVWRFLQPVLDLMQTMPTFVYLIPSSSSSAWALRQA
jgi:glycine betaine/proline transport system permease protein